VPLVLLPLFGVALSFLVLFVVLYGMHKGSNSWLNPLLAGIVPRKRGFWGVVLTVGGLLAAPLVNAALRVFHSVSHAISIAASHQMGPTNSWLHAHTGRETLITHAHARFMSEVATGFERGFEIKVPRDIRKKTGPIAKKAGAALGLAGLTAAALRRYAHGIDRLLHEKVVPQIRHLTHAVDHTLPRELGRTRARVRGLEEKVAHPSRAWTRRLAHAMWAAALLGLLVKWLARRFPWLFCRKVSNIGKRACGLDAGLLESLLADTLVIAGAVSLVEFTHLMQDVTEPSVDLMRGFIREF
jgi:hypothetical protein